MANKFGASMMLPEGFKPVTHGKVKKHYYKLCTGPGPAFALNRLTWYPVSQFPDMVGKPVGPFNTLFIRPICDQGY